MSDAKKVFEKAVMNAIDFLRSVDRNRGSIDESRRKFLALRRGFPKLQLELVVDIPPGNMEVDYDVLISNEQRETTMLGWHHDEGRPWSVDYSEHWAANYVATVNKRDITIREALTFLRQISDKDPNLFRQFIDEALMASAVEQDCPAVSDREIAQAGRNFKRFYGLSSEDDLDSWLKKTGLNRDGWRAWLIGGIQLSKFRDRLCKGRFQSYFKEHKQDLAEILIHRVSFPNRDSAEQLLHKARTMPLNDAVCEMRWQGSELVSETELVRLDEIPPEARKGIVPGALWGPCGIGARHVVYQFLKMRPARLDASTRSLIRKRLVSAWLAAEHAASTVHWHW